MRYAALTTFAASLLAAVGWAKGARSLADHDWLGWGWGGKWLGPSLIVVPLSLLFVAVVASIRWMGGGARTGRVRAVRDIPDEFYRGEIDREGYLRRGNDIPGH